VTPDTPPPDAGRRPPKRRRAGRAAGEASPQQAGRAQGEGAGRRHERRVARLAALQEERKAARIAARRAERKAARAAERRAARLAAAQEEARQAAADPDALPPADAPLGVVARHLTVEFRPFSERRPSLRRHGLEALRRHEKPIVAVDDVSLNIYRGEALGIIGSNGAGKTTLLRVLAGTLPSDTGTVEVYSEEPPTMLSLGAGFNRNLSGRRNIYLGGLAAGLQRDQIDAMFDDIVEYSGLGEAIDRPASTYSSGMFARLTFAVAIRRRPQILLLDEVFAVGDQAFRKKSSETMKELLADAGTIVMVSHSLGRLRVFCHRLAWMESGRLMAVGNPQAVAAMYLAHLGMTEEEEEDD